MPRMDDWIDFLGEASVFSMLFTTLATGRCRVPLRTRTRRPLRTTREHTSTCGSLLVGPALRPRSRRPFTCSCRASNGRTA